MNSILKNSFKLQFKRKPQTITLEMLGKKKITTKLVYVVYNILLLKQQQRPLLEHCRIDYFLKLAMLLNKLSERQ